MDILPAEELIVFSMCTAQNTYWSKCFFGGAVKAVDKDETYFMAILVFR
jgi:hypothetical protein